MATLSRKMLCPKCGKQVEKGLLVCPYCGGEIDSPLADCLERAVDLLDREEKESAFQFLQRVVEKYPQSASAHSLLASLYEEKGDLPLAVFHYRRAVEIDPESEAERKKLEMLTGEKWKASRVPSTLFALPPLFALFLVILFFSFPRKSSVVKPPTNQLFPYYEGYPSLNYPPTPYANLPYSEKAYGNIPLSNLPSPTAPPSEVPRRTTPREETQVRSGVPNERKSLPVQLNLPPANIVIEPVPPQQGESQGQPTPPPKQGKIIYSLKKVPLSFDEVYSQARQKLNDKDYQSAEALLRQALKLAPSEKKGEVCFYLGLCLRDEGNYKEARDAFASAVSALSQQKDPASQALLPLAEEGRKFCEERM